MTDDQRTLALGVYLSALIYLSGCIAVGLATGNVLAAKIAVGCAADCYFAYVSQLMIWPRVVQTFFVVFSVLLGAAAGIVILIGGTP